MKESLKLRTAFVVVLTIGTLLFTSTMSSMAYSKEANTTSSVAENSVNTSFSSKISDEFVSERDFIKTVKNELDLDTDDQVREKVLSDLENLKACYFFENDISAIDVKGGALSYTFDIAENQKAELEVCENSSGDIIVDITEDNLHNELIYASNGKVYVDGHEVQLSGVEVSSKPVDDTLLKVEPNYWSKNYTKNVPAGSSSAKYKKFIETYKVANLNAGTTWKSLTLSTLYSITSWSIGECIAILISAEVAGQVAIPIAVVSTVMQALLSENKAAIPAKDAHYSYSVSIYKNAEESNGYQRLYMHYGYYYSQPKYAGTVWQHTFWEYQYFN